MTAVVFENAGEIDPLAIATFGVSVKSGPSPIGFFGTGLKYALAILLRTGHRVAVQAGERVHEFRLVEATIRGAPFKLVTMDGASMGFTSDLGRTWEVWMAYRELYCNAKDEGGSAYECEEVPTPTAGLTRVVVWGDEFLTQHRHRDVFILEGEPDVVLNGCSVHYGESRGLFYRGMLVHRFPKTEMSRHTYDFTCHVDLTEDRTAKYVSFLKMHLAASLMEAEDGALVRELLTLPDKYYEHELSFRDEGVWGVPTPSPAFLDAVEELSKDRAARVNVTAVMRLKEVRRKQLTPDGAQLTGVEAEVLERAVAFCKTLGFYVDAYPLIIADSLGDNVLGMAEGERIYVCRRAFMRGTKQVAATLIEEFIHLKHGLRDGEPRDLQDFLLDRLLSLGEEMRGEPL